MTRIITILTEGYADWEIALLTGTARSFYGLDIKHAAPSGQPIRSAGGLKVTPDLAIEWIDLETTDALVVCGGSLWPTERAPDLSDLLRRAHDSHILIGGICDGTRPLARAGLLDGIGHTSNSLDTLLETGYGGRSNYWDVPRAVLTDRVVTAPGTAPVSFMAEILDGLGLADSNLDYYLGLLAAEHGSNHRAAAAPAPATSRPG